MHPSHTPSTNARARAKRAPQLAAQALQVALILAATAVLTACDRPPRESTAHGEGDGHDHGAASSGAAAAPTNRVEIPTSVRQSLGIEFAKVEYRNVARTLRVPGRFEYQPTARREYRTPLGGRVEVFVEQYQGVEPGTPLYRVDSASWRELHEAIIIAQARADSMVPLREAHRRHEQSLSEKVALWQERLVQLDELRAAGGGSAAQFTEARATLNATQADLANVMEKDAELEAQQKQAQAELRALQSRRELLARAAYCPPTRHAGSRASDAASEEVDAARGGDSRGDDGGGFTVCAVAPGVVESIGVTPGGLLEENGLVLSIVQPTQIRFRARGLQSDLGRVRDGLAARIVPPQGGAIDLQDAMEGALTIGLSADADERTIDLVVTPRALASWARSGVWAHLEITLEGGNQELAIPTSAVLRDGAMPIIFRRDPANVDRAIRMEADLGLSDGRWIVINSGVKEGDQVVVAGNYQLMLATSNTAAKGGHFHADGTFHEGKDE